jgi:hypothetical protein
MDIKRRRALGASLSPAGEVYLVCCTGGGPPLCHCPSAKLLPAVALCPAIFRKRAGVRLAG